MNFVVGQVTRDMLTGITYGTYSFFGLMTFLGAAFIWLVVPETKGLSLEEMDVLFKSVGFSEADAQIMREVNAEVGLDDLIMNGDSRSAGSHEKGRVHVESDNEKMERSSN